MTPAQITQLKTYIQANTTYMAQPHNANGADFIAQDLSKVTADFYVWNNAMPVQVIFDSITWANFTPTDAPDGTAAWTNRSLACQGKQFNLQTILTGRETINASKTNVRAGLQDALSNIPSGVGGAVLSGGWVTVRDAMKKLATGLEKALSTGTGTLASPAVTSTDSQTIGFWEVQSVMEWW